MKKPGCAHYKEKEVQ